MKSDLSAIGQIINKPKNIVITMHHNPDGDALGSSLGLYHFLKHLGHKVSVVAPNDFPAFLKWLPGAKQVCIYDYHPEKGERLIASADVIFCLDFNSLERLHGLEKPVGQSGATKILADHHPQPTDFAHYSLHNAEASSSAEIIYDMICGLDRASVIDLDVATCLYVGILTDTGSYQFSSTTAKVHRIAAELIDKGVPGHQIFDKVYNNSSIDRIRFFGFCTTERLRIYPDQKAALIYVSKDDLERFNLKKGDTEGLVNVPLQVKGILFSTLIMDKDDMIKMSFRSKGDFDVNTFARKHFNGGGHKNAAGGRSDQSFEQTIQSFEKMLPEYTTIINKIN